MSDKNNKIDNPKREGHSKMKLCRQKTCLSFPFPIK